MWKHKDFYSNDPRIKFVSKGWAQKTDTGIAGDLMAACVELIPLYRFVKHNRGMILHAHTRMGIIAGSIVGWLTGTAPVVVHHHALAGRPWLYRQWWRLFGSKVVFNSTRTCRHYGCDPRDAMTVYPSIRWPDQPAQPSGPFRFVAAGAFVPIKNFHLLIDAFIHNQNSWTNTELLIYGRSARPLSPSYQESLVAMAQHPAIQLLEHDRQWADQLTDNDVFVWGSQRWFWGELAAGA